MKKTLILFTLIFAMSFSVFAAEDSSEKKEGWSSMTYVNVPILKIMESKEAYVVIYQKNKIGIGTTVIPKSWSKGTPDNPRKLKFRKREPGLLQPYMTVVKNNGEFHRVILTVPLAKSDSVWGVIRTEVEGSDKETLEDLAL